MADTPKFKLYLSDGNTKMTLTENHPKLDADNTAFTQLGTQLAKGYEKQLVEATIESETVVFTAS